jgi:phosphoglycolate phosphatase
VASRTSTTALLALFDCDGTLFLGDDELARDAMLEALNELTGARLGPADFDALDHRARTARWIGREAIAKHDLPEIELADWIDLVERIYLDRVSSDDRVDWHAPAGTKEALDALLRDGIRVAPLTGVPERIARFRFDQLELSEFFEPGQGAFGSEADDRAELIALALARAGLEPADAVEIGDTSRDVATARAAGLGSIAVAFDGPPPADADRADAVIESMAELPRALRRLREH